MDHGMADQNACKVDMLWNWNVKDACFLSSGWHITSRGMMAASCIGIALLVVLLEFLRLMGKKYDAMILAQMKRRGNVILAATSPFSDEDTTNSKGARQSCRPATQSSARGRKIVLRVSPVQQLLRAVLYAVTFFIAYIIMLLAMSYNGAVLISIVVGAGLGKFLTDWLSLTIESNGEDDENKAEGIEELTVCCQ
ncbi:hypothetical protein NLU13_3433 [Sarocladium strictum]|uniref:Copper transport protein n=1 Tax=Sarocladium strictum TaxID=5046 RepID=A0AA39GM07_SARSR|nr:hypothetical protein NLU13_3433 [Sarocladium strictum]